MKCKEFQIRVLDVLRAERKETTAQASDALAHAAACPQCVALLDSERRLSADLRALAASQASEGASTAVEQRLLQAFRAEMQAKQIPAPAPRLVLAWNWRMWGAVAAGLAVFVLGLYTALHHRVPNSPANAAARASIQTNTVGSTPSVASIARKQSAEAPALTRTKEKLPPKKPAPQQRNRPANPIVVEPDEMATAFYAIPYAAPLQPEEGTRIVRVSVPQSTLAALGWPASQEPGSGAVNADLLVGEDNLARAIRLVRTRGSAGPQLRPASIRSEVH